MHAHALRDFSRKFKVVRATPEKINGVINCGQQLCFDKRELIAQLLGYPINISFSFGQSGLLLLGGGVVVVVVVVCVCVGGGCYSLHC